MKKIAFLLFICISYVSYSQHIEGTVFSNEDNQKVPLPGANVYWANTTTGTITNSNGQFEIHATVESKKLVFSFVGYKTDTIEWNGEHELEMTLQKNLELEEVTVVKKNRGNYISAIEPIYTENINGAELHKAACCNLSESFETNPSVDVSYSDAVTGAKQIKLLGLAGTYSQLQTENFPNLRGLATNYGLTYIPGPWLESIQVSKGAASVVNGYESITGQINANFKKPDSQEAFYLNLFGSAEGKSEINSNASFRLSDKVSTAFFIHGENFQNRIDHNDDDFLDDPLVEQIHLFNFWKYNNHKGLMVQSGIHYLYEDRLGGEKTFRKNMERTSLNPYGVNINTNRVEAFLKGGYDLSHFQSIALISNFTFHDMNSYYGLNNYSGNEHTFYLNLVHSMVLDKFERHQFNSGFSLMVDHAEEKLNGNISDLSESVPGIFTEYTFKPNPQITLLAGLRSDFSNEFGTFVTPRFHLRYGPSEHMNFRISAGKGYRVPRIMAENNFLLANGRPLEITQEKIREEAWNYGISLTRDFHVFERELTLSSEFFRTNFINQLIVDRESSADKIILLPLDGKSYANSFQLEMRYELLPRLDIVAAYRSNKVMQTINGELLRKPLTSKYKGLLTFNYTDRFKSWMFDYTIQFNGGGRLPVLPNSPIGTPDEFSPFTIMNAQVTKYFKKWNIYMGSENLFDFKQDNPIIAANDPFSQEFDATQIWGPVLGRRVYIGLRLSLNQRFSEVKMF